ncbi:sigma-70 family RNA polymerase sigma factor [Scatolibacter rhodanostii]|uniref:sigma-70 family RNA polymerase sigma factor n=1 Tax=Scatolibacter rhodanostii TaxID=2014781 RepID=UPI000C06BC5C|nr:sigma-70 family RNA polymerase sigma factor [Scatolibacter rhodanostii]
MNQSSAAIKEVTVEDPEGLMRKYKQTGDLEIRNQLVMHYIQHVNVAIYSMRSILLSSVPFDDFFNQGVLALMDCIERYDPERGLATFDTYCYTGVRGGILKYLRKQNWLPNRLWEARKQISQGKKKLEQKLMRQPTNQELAEYLAISEEKLSQQMVEISVIDTISFEEMVGQTYENILYHSSNGNNDDVSKNIMVEELRQALAKAIDELPPKQKQIITLHYYEGLNLREIGEVLDLSPQRISQRRKKALDQLHETLEQYR